VSRGGVEGLADAKHALYPGGRGTEPLCHLLGLRIQTNAFDERVPVRASTGADGVRGAELVLFAVKSPDTEAAGRAAAPFLEREAAILTLQNGVDNAERLAATEVHTNEIVQAINKELREMIKAIKEVFQDTPPELASDIMDGGIIMTGGTSQLRNFPELIRRRTGVKAQLADQALFCVAKGTGIALEHLDTYKRTIIAKR
jgi:cell division ATPase FtsA